MPRHRYPGSRRHTSRAQDALTEEQLDALLAAVNARTPTGKRNLALLLVMADAGLRVSEATALPTTDLVAEGGQYTHVDIRRGKGGKPGRVALTERAAAATGVWLKARSELALGHGPLFCTISSGTAGGHWAEPGQALQPGRPVSTEYVRQLVHRAARRAGIPTRVTPLSQPSSRDIGRVPKQAEEPGPDPYWSLINTPCPATSQQALPSSIPSSDPSSAEMTVPSW